MIAAQDQRDMQPVRQGLARPRGHALGGVDAALQVLEPRVAHVL